MMSRIPIADTIIEKNGKILFIKRNFEPHKNKLDLPGGFVEKGETFQQAAIREFKEETGLKVTLIYKLPTVDYFDRQPKTAHTFIGKISGGKLKNTEEGRPVWVDLDKIKTDDLSVPNQFIPVLKLYSKYKQSIKTLNPQVST